MTSSFKRAIQDILQNRFLNTVTIITIALIILIVSSFALFFINVNDIMNSWKKGIRIMAYIKPDIERVTLYNIKQKIEKMYGVRQVRFISKEEAIDQLKKQLELQSSLLDNLEENPLPDAFEIKMIASTQSWKKVKTLSVKIESIPSIESVEYGQKWLGQFANILNLFKLTGYVMGCVFFLASVFIIANTIRLALYSKREEIEIMRLVGASDSFIKTPFYFEGLIQGATGGIVGLVILFSVFIFISSTVGHGICSDFINIRFLPFDVSCGIILGSMFVGWLGCFLSLKQFLKT